MIVTTEVLVIAEVVKGVFRDVSAARAEFLSLVSKGGPR